MAIRSGFFNSVNGDRKYDASRFAEYFASFVGNGVFPNPSDNLQVIANNNMTVTVRPGKAWINGYILINDDDYILTLDTADGVLDRIDRIVVRCDVAAREIQIAIKKGEISSNPTAPDLQRDADAYELALADIYIAAGTTSITQANITDLRLNTELCGIVHGTVEQVDTTTLFNQYVDWYTTTTGQAETDIEAIKQQFQVEFDAWFAGIKDILDENAAGNLLNLIEEHKNDTNNPHNVTPQQIGAASQEDFDSHKTEKATQEQLGHVKAGNNITIDADGTINAKGGNVDSVNGKTGEVVIDVGDIAGLVSSKLALGLDASAAPAAVALGLDASAGGDRSVAIGLNASAGSSAVALGLNASAEDYAVALGRGASAGGDFSVALGEGASAGGDRSVALGQNASAENANEGILGGAEDDYSPSKWIVPGSFTVRGTKNFEIPHPKPEKRATHVIRHGAVESPTPGDTLYRWKIQATKDNDIITIDLPDYFIYLNKDVQIWVTGQGHFGNGYGTLNRETEQLEIHCQFAGEYNVLVIGTRNDDHQSVKDWDIKGVEREIGESWTGETYAFSVDEIIEVKEIKEVS